MDFATPDDKPALLHSSFYVIPAFAGIIELLRL